MDQPLACDIPSLAQLGLMDHLAGDPFQSLRGEGSEGSIIGPATLMLCCVCCCLSLLIAYIIWALVTIFVTFGRVYIERVRASYNIWAFCLTAVVIMPLIGFIISLTRNNREGASILQFALAMVNLGISVWGMWLWASISNNCWTYFESSFWDLALLFKINVILLAITFFMTLCVMCMGIMFLGSSIPGSTDSGYQRMPNEDDDKDEALRSAASAGKTDEVWRHCAASSGRKEIVEILVAAGADIDAETQDGETPLRLANGHPDVEDILRSLGARDSMANAQAATQEFV
ncbi:hypothetical protein GUITHDRAFT_102548 [Guillardia theta CCMP2712]|uniref:Uncharacterized protein n=1 Tax=Guillardia theta (strain CCMP2712) TaxID=905079 RepID=L1JU43_GUITC|nr:hypothetical protein GUITHDRAFT_102548 [Guillardia theta CCMP2712]EKX51937.1 hypothetical protein GUITHDRAFT_102548 [Guillardia theta CCMP2712]|eukprot:XP_005838917.1 hypothetical protein GUITHDRAFT_102548 [Guillardia theta CCMP2712]